MPEPTISPIPEHDEHGDDNDRLAALLERHFGLLDARRHAAALRQDGVRDEAIALHEQALAAQRAAIVGKLPLAAIEAANAEHKRTLALVEQVQRWRAAGFEQLALDVFLLAPTVAGAVARGWHPSAAPAREAPPLLLRRPALRFADHFEPDIDLLIVDHRLGTISLVQWLALDQPERARERVREYVDRATYLRHLLAAEQGRERQIFTIELVVVHPAAEPDAPGFALLAAIGELLRELALETDCLHAVGVNLLPWQAAREPDDDELRRAFAWLLRDSQRWFEAIELHDAARGQTSDDRLARVTLDEYRVAGRRELILHPGARLHLLHGHNGSGKSSLVEALELMLTGGIERLAGVDDYEQVVRNRNASEPAAIELEDRGGRSYAFTVAGPTRPRPLAPGTRAASFRLDQTVMDRLARASEVDRAAELLAAFFAEEAATRERWRAAMAGAKREIEALPERLRVWLRGRQREHQDLHEVVVEHFAGLGEGRLRRELVDALLPIELDTLLAMRGRIPALGLLDERLAHDGSIAGDDPIFTSLEYELGALLGELDSRRASLQAAIRALERAGRWWHEGARPQGDDDFGQALDEWLELGALAELVEQQRTIVAALQAARAQGWDPHRLEQAGRGAALLRTLAQSEPELLDDLEAARARWSQRRAELSTLLDQRPRRDADARGEATPSATRVRLEPDEVEALDELGHWLALEEVPLGERIRQAITTGSPTSFAGRTIGAHEWATPLREQARALLVALDRLAQGWREPQPAPPIEHAHAPEHEHQHQQEDEHEHEDELVGLADHAQARDEDAPNLATATRERESIGELPITIEEVERSRAPSLDPADDEPAPEADDEGDAGPLARVAQRFLGRSKREQRAHQQALARRASPSASLAKPMPEPAMRGPAQGGAASSPAPRPVPSGAATSVAPVRSPTPVTSPTPTPTPTSTTPSPAASTPRSTSATASKRIELRRMLEHLQRAHAASLAAQQVGSEVRQSFIAKLAANDEGAMGLVDALNELMALFTPARWAYEDVQLRYEEGDAPRLQFETGSAGSKTRSRADLRLNTAQLNAFVLALFLLCAPRVSNPLGLLVLDDPLQNMDELTVTTLARGLAKLLRVLPRRWTLLMLFHGEGDLARFHDEVECGVYLLPWLSPTQRGSSIRIESRPQTSRLGLPMQRLLGFVTLRP